jgi:hypothetical protein
LLGARDRLGNTFAHAHKVARSPQA